MKVIVTENYEEMSKKAAEVIADVVKADENAVLGLATGTTPIGLYKELIAKCEKKELSFKNVKTVNLDEYVGLAKTHVQSYDYFMKDNLFNHIDIDIANTNLPSGVAENLDEECARYTALLNKMQQSVQLLGLGSNGHIGFNEPKTPFDSTTHIVSLTESTIKDNSRLFDNIDEVPTKAITMGIANIMNAKKVLVVASGDNKAKAVYSMVKGPVTEDCPASVLQNHADVVVIVDKKAAALL
ncbi:MAG: glucosamine-6-phosphate deaminase [Bacillota bacterium]|nr:MAG: glucosamine-6-phosphate deaminase [Bacillota bacterium]